MNKLKRILNITFTIEAKIWQWIVAAFLTNLISILARKFGW